MCACLRNATLSYSCPHFYSRLTCAMCREVECLAKKFSDTLLIVGVGVGESVGFFFHET